MSTIQIATPFNVLLDFEIAAIHKRIFAWLLDLAIMVCYAWVLGNFVNSDFVVGIGSKAVTGWSLLLVSLPILLYPLASEILLHGQSIGKKVMDIRVMSLAGGEPSLSQYVIRWMFRFFEWPLVFGVVLPNFYIISQLFVMAFPGIVVLITVAVTAKNQRLGDLAANTVLVKTRINTSIHDTIFQEVDSNNYQLLFPQVMQLSDRDINTIKTVLGNSNTKYGKQMVARTADRVRTALKIETELEDIIFLDKLLLDYNYLAAKE